MTWGRRVAAAAIVAVACAAAGCGDDDGTAATAGTPSTAAHVTVAADPAPTTTTATSPPSVSPPPAPSSTLRPPPVSSAPPAPAGTAPAGLPLASDARVVSAPSFTSVGVGWTLAVAADGATVVAHTLDGGRSWSEVARPSIDAESCPDARLVFADEADGWLLCQQLAATHDGGRTWTPVMVDGDAVTALAVDTGAGAVDVVAVQDPQHPVFRLLVSPVDHDAFVPSGVSFEPAAGPVPAFTFAFTGEEGWVVYSDRTVVAGAHLSAGTWTDWSPPCLDTGGDARPVAGPQAGGELLVVCNEGTWTGDAPSVHTLRSRRQRSDVHGDRAVAPARPVPDGDGRGTRVGDPDPGRVPVRWQFVPRRIRRRRRDVAGPRPRRSPWVQIDFLDPTDGVARVDDAVVVSHDGGRHWDLSLG